MWRNQRSSFQTIGIGGQSNNKRRGGYRRRKRRRLTTRRNVGFKALREVRQVKRELSKNVNFKSSNTALSGAPTPGTPVVQLVNGMVRGVTDYLREGDQISMKSLSWRILLRLGVNEPNAGEIRLVLVYDRRNNGAQAAVTDVLTGQAVYNLIKNDVEVNRGRFQILYDQMYTLTPATNYSVMSKGFINLKGKKVLYAGTAGTIGDIKKGSLFFMYMCRNTTIALAVNGEARLTFLDDN